MIIIREGENINKARVFACGMCGCVFEANSKEYNMQNSKEAIPAVALIADIQQVKRQSLRRKKMYRNGEGYADPTACDAMREVKKEEDMVAKENHRLINTFRRIAEWAGFEIVGRIELRHKKTGRNFK